MSGASLARGLRGFPWLLVLAAAAVMALSFLVIRSASFDAATGAHAPYAERQLAWALAGWAAFLVVAFAPYDRIAARADGLYVLSLVALALVFAIGTRTNNSVRWFAVGSVRIQPSEPAKYALVLLLARVLSGEGDRVRTLRGLVVPALLALVPLALVAKQPDLTTACTFLPILLAMVFVAGARTVHLASVFATVALAAPVAWRFLLHDYQRQRIHSFLDPTKSALGGAYQALQSQIAVGSGGLLGKGFERGTQGALGYLPERHTDFIFAVVGEEWGLAGGLVLLALYATILYALATIAARTRDLEGRLIVTGVAAILVTHVGVNVGMATGAFPVAGIPLPLVSYGGSSLVATLLGFGLAASVARRKVVVWTEAKEDQAGAAARSTRAVERALERD